MDTNQTTDAATVLNENIEQRNAEQQVQQAQQQGKVAQQNTHQQPSAGNPEGGLPTDSDSSAETETTANNGEETLHATNETGPTLGDVAEKKTLADTDVVPRTELLALAAEFQNFRNAANRRLDETRDRAARGVLEDLLPVLDNLEMGLKFVRDARDAESMKQGIEFIAQQFRDVMKSHGVEPIASQGQQFDPLRHDAIEQVSSDQPEGTIVEEAQSGYLYKGQILRPARVKVAGK